MQHLWNQLAHQVGVKLGEFQGCVTQHQKEIPLVIHAAELNLCLLEVCANLDISECIRINIDENENKIGSDVTYACL